MLDVSGGTDFWAGIIDLPFGAVLAGCALWLRARRGVHRYWVLTCAFGAASAGMGAVHHLFLQSPEWLAAYSWIATGILLIIALSYLLAASAMDVLGPEATRTVLTVRSIGLAAYLVAALFGLIGTGVLVLCESLTMAGVVGLWCYAAYRKHPRGIAMLVGIGVSALSAATYLIPADLLLHIDVRPGSLSHLVQIPGFILIARAAAAHRDPQPGSQRSARVGRERVEPQHVR